MNAHRSEKGQAIVLIILSIVGLFGFAALAVDMGQIYSERRRAQSAADAAALAAAYEANTGTGNPIWVAEDMTYENGGYENNEVDTWVEVNNPPVDSPYEYCPACNNNFDFYDYFQVKITRKLNPIFMQIFGRNFSMLTVEAVAHARPVDSISPGNAVHATSNDALALTVDGGVNARITGGNLRSNGGGDKDGKPKTPKIEVIDAKVYTATGWSNPFNVFPAPKVDGPVFPAIPNTPNCNRPAGTVSVDGKKGTTTYTPGVYENVINTPNGVSVMKPGMYCLKDGMTINGTSQVSGDGIFIVLLGGDIEIKGGAYVNWKRPNNLLDGLEPGKEGKTGNQWGGMLIYVPRRGDGKAASEVHLTGTSGTSSGNGLTRAECARWAATRPHSASRARWCATTSICTAPPNWSSPTSKPRTSVQPPWSSWFSKPCQHFNSVIQANNSPLFALINTQAHPKG